MLTLIRERTVIKYLKFTILHERLPRYPGTLTQRAFKAISSKDMKASLAAGSECYALTMFRSFHWTPSLSLNSRSQSATVLTLGSCIHPFLRMSLKALGLMLFRTALGAMSTSSFLYFWTFFSGDLLSCVASVIGFSPIESASPPWLYRGGGGGVYRRMWA